jgi:N-sulfoglucosamine sulfohydrolase
MNERPNIVLMVSDDHGRQMGCYGDPNARTPSLDALAADGVRFEKAFCTASTCAPSRAVILSGLHNHTNGMYGLAHPPHNFFCFGDFRSLPARLAEAGYRTGRIGKYHVAPEELFPFQEVLPFGTGARDDVAMSERCRDFVAGDEPFFLYWCSYNPHRARMREDLPLQPNSFGNPQQDFPGDEEELFDPAELEIPDFLSDTPEVRAELAQYYQSVARLDRGVGRLMQILKDSGKYENTLILYISDNGPAFPEGKTTLYEAGMNLPLLVKSPEHPDAAGGMTNALASWVDLAPTLLDFAGADFDAGDFHGRSLRGLIGEEDPDDEDTAIYASHSLHEITNYYPMRVIRTQRWKFIWNIAHPLTYSFASDLYRSATWQGVLRDGLEHFGPRSVEAYLHRPRFELYDLQADPLETENLADRPERAELVERFCKQLQDFQERTGDPWLHKWRYE